MAPFQRALGLSVTASVASALTVVDVSKEDLPSKIAVQACSGLLNRGKSAVFVLGLNRQDEQWLEDLEGISKPTITPVKDFMSNCMKSSAVKGHIRYNFKSQQIVVPEIITLAGVLDAVPLQDDSSSTASSPVAFDAVKVWNNFTALEATQYLLDHHIHQTSGMAKMNPGLDTHHGDPAKPKLTGLPDPGLIDFIVKKRLFNFFLNDGCIPLTKEHALMEKIASSNPWPRPITVYGYDDSYGHTGDLFEAETNCVSQHNMGQVASNGFSNMAYWSNKQTITTPLVQNPEAPSKAYDRTKTYITFIIGDGDNLNFLKGSRRDWMTERVMNCKSGKGCFPLLWTISPNVVKNLPDLGRWYYNQSYLTKQDYFVLPPSGHLYAYPSQMGNDDQAAFVTATETDCKLLNTSGTVTWEWFYSWDKAVVDFFPQYAKNGVVRSLFAVNVPFNLPTGVFLPGEHFKVFGGKTVLFAPREWRGTSGKGDVPLGKHNDLTAADMAKEINGYKKGSVTNIYMTSDGGAKMQDFYDLVALLDSHVEVVSHTAIADMAIAAKKHQDAEQQKDVVV